MLKRLYCWFNGHDYVYGFGSRFRSNQIMSITVCIWCGARSIVSSAELTRRMENSE